jgi:hypothetical protein
MWFPVVLPFRHAFPCLADPDSLAVQFSQQQFGDLPGVFSVFLIQMRGAKTGCLAMAEIRA